LILKETDRQARTGWRVSEIGAQGIALTAACSARAEVIL
jgi:hypothetical protein